MKDSFGREIDYLRVSITDRCNLRCVYCMPEESPSLLPRTSMLSYEHILRICGVMAGLGIRKIKLTGGEPLVRKGMAGLVAGLAALPGIECVTLTTNGTLLAGHATALARAGIGGVNVSLDTLDAGRYRTLTRGGSLGTVLAGIEQAVGLGIPVKLNCVPTGSSTVAELVELALFARHRNIQVRFIELMPIGYGRQCHGLENTRLRTLLEKRFGPMLPARAKLGNGPAQYYTLPGFVGHIGFISAVGDCFCGGCNRIRLTADGYLKNCLYAHSGLHLSPCLAHEDGMLASLIRSVIISKPHSNALTGSNREAMFRIGG